MVTVTDAEIQAAVLWLFRHAKLVVEPSGAVGVAAILTGLSQADASTGFEDRVAVAVLSGGNIAPETFAGMVGR